MKNKIIIILFVMVLVIFGIGIFTHMAYNEPIIVYPDGSTSETICSKGTEEKSDGRCYSVVSDFNS